LGRRGDHHRDGAERPVRSDHRPLEVEMSISAQPTEPTPPAANGTPALEVRGVTKSFGVLDVLRGVDLTLRQGEVLGLVGDNGAGKSTLVKILSGFHQPDGGEVLIGGERVSFGSVQSARSQGIETVYQDLALIPQLPVYQNLFLGHEITTLGPIRLLNKREMRKLARQYLDDINVNVPSVDADAELLSGGQRQAIAVARAVRAARKILLLDEPLAAMGARESRLIIDLVKDLATSGRLSIIVIDHNYAHLFELCDRINVMQGGRITIDQQVHETSLEELTELMVSSYRRQIEEVQNAGA
jgi:simple sugar transport system ATP-binding protein